MVANPTYIRSRSAANPDDRKHHPCDRSRNQQKQPQLDDAPPLKRKRFTQNTRDSAKLVRLSVEYPIVGELAPVPREVNHRPDEDDQSGRELLPLAAGFRSDPRPCGRSKRAESGIYIFPAAPL